jgi:hypothetical protein
VRSLCCTPEENELMLEILISVSDKGLKLLEQAEGKFKQELMTNKWRNYKIVAGLLIKMAKYFNKIRLQLKAKEKKAGDNSVSDIQKFLNEYENYETEIQFF